MLLPTFLWNSKYVPICTNRCSFQLKWTLEAVKLPQLLFLFTQNMICRSTVLMNSGAHRSLLTENFYVLNFKKSQLHQNGTKLGDFYGIGNVNTQKHWGFDWSRLSGCKKKNCHICGLRSEMTDHRKWCKFLCTQSTNLPQCRKKYTAMTGWNSKTSRVQNRHIHSHTHTRTHARTHTHTYTLIDIHTLTYTNIHIQMNWYGYNHIVF